jgi:hypothetical protein
MPTLECYRFGRLIVDGKEQTRDVIVLPERVITLLADRGIPTCLGGSRGCPERPAEHLMIGSLPRSRGFGAEGSKSSPYRLRMPCAPRGSRYAPCGRGSKPDGPRMRRPCPFTAPAAHTGTRRQRRPPERGAVGVGELLPGPGPPPSSPGAGSLTVVVNDPPAFARWQIGQIEWGNALRSGAIEVKALPALARAFPTWNRRAWAADDPRARFKGSTQYQPNPPLAAFA